MSLVQTLADTPTDIIGDIHGEFEALEHLLAVLGYPAAGPHPDGRQLVFTGDLVDRGPDSPAVVERVMALVEEGVAHCVLGNHELNILRGVRKGGNDWLLDAGSEQRAAFRYASTGQACRYRDFFERQPFALVGPHLRVVHACWNDASVAALARLSAEGGIGALYRELEAAIVAGMANKPVAGRKRDELAQYGERIADRQWSAVVLPAHAEVDLALQMDNPLRVLTTSEEMVAREPYWAGGKWRMTQRVPWWDHYRGEVPVVIGHFWRMFDSEARRVTGMFGPDVFEGVPSHAWMGRHKNVYCVDYSVGQRHLERQQDSADEFHGKLAALRYPEWEVVHDDRSAVTIGAPG